MKSIKQWSIGLFPRFKVLEEHPFSVSSGCHFTTSAIISGTFWPVVRQQLEHPLLFLLPDCPLRSAELAECWSARSVIVAPSSALVSTVPGLSLGSQWRAYGVGYRIRPVYMYCTFSLLIGDWRGTYSPANLTRWPHTSREIRSEFRDHVDYRIHPGLCYWAIQPVPLIGDWDTGPRHT